MVLHDLALVMNHPDHVPVMAEGRLLADGPPAHALAPERIAQGWGGKRDVAGRAGAAGAGDGRTGLKVAYFGGFTSPMSSFVAIKITTVSVSP